MEAWPAGAFMTVFGTRIGFIIVGPSLKIVSIIFNETSVLPIDTPSIIPTLSLFESSIFRPESLTAIAAAAAAIREILSIFLIALESM